MKIFISHSHEEQILANAWKTLFDDLGTSIDAWYSSDRRPKGGMEIGLWREKIENELKEADIVLALCTPESVEKKWLYIECAYALGLGQEKEIIPLTYFMKKNELSSFLQDRQVFEGDKEESMKELYGKLLTRKNEKPVNDKVLEIVIKDYLEEVKTYRQKRFEKSLFHGHFHDYGVAQKMKGEWFAKWTHFKDDGKEEPFETHPVHIWTTKNRLRVTGKGKDWADYYPMEGVVSSKGHIALTYWSQGEIPICGTALFELIGGNRIMEGSWEGFTAKSLRERLSLVKGRAIIARDKSEVENYWDI